MKVRVLSAALMDIILLGGIILGALVLFITEFFPIDVTALVVLGLLLIFGLVLSIVLMATAATLISNWIKKYKWIAWAGLLAILIVAIELIYTDIKILFL